jgi:hypothetical protein
MDDRLSRAAANNAHWCRTVCAAHGMASRFFDDYWLLEAGSTLPLYPNLATLREEGSDAQLACIEQHHRSGFTPWSVKDSFSRLDLRPMGFDVLFDAEWFFGPPDAPTQGGAGENGGGQPGTCQRVGSVAELRAWETAWAQRTRDWSFGDCVFPPGLLHEERIAFLFARGDTGIRAGLVANCDAGVVGLSNAFARSGRVSDLVGCLRLAWTATGRLRDRGRDRGAGTPGLRADGTVSHLATDIRQLTSRS